MYSKYVTGNSLFRIDYELTSLIWTAFSWTLAAAITGFIGISLSVIQPNIAGCFGVSISWRVLLVVLTGSGQDSFPSSGLDEEPGEG